MASFGFLIAVALGWVIDIFVFVSAMCVLASADKNQKWEYKIYIRKLEPAQDLFLSLQ